MRRDSWMEKGHHLVWASGYCLYVLRCSSLEAEHEWTRTVFRSRHRTQRQFINFEEGDCPQDVGEMRVRRNI
jgi:hypothetical protein